MNIPCLCPDGCGVCEEPKQDLSPAKQLAALAAKRQKEKERSDKFWELYCRYMGAMYGGL